MLQRSCSDVFAETGASVVRKAAWAMELVPAVRDLFTSEAEC